MVLIKYFNVLNIGIMQELMEGAQALIVVPAVRGSTSWTVVNLLPTKNLCATYVGRTSTGVTRQGAKDASSSWSLEPVPSL